MLVGESRSPIQQLASVESTSPGKRDAGGRQEEELAHSVSRALADLSPSSGSSTSRRPSVLKLFKSCSNPRRNSRATSARQRTRSPSPSSAVDDKICSKVLLLQPTQSTLRHAPHQRHHRYPRLKGLWTFPDPLARGQGLPGHRRPRRYRTSPVLLQAPLTPHSTRAQGLATTRDLALAGAKVYIASRTPSKVHAAIAELVAAHPSLQGRLEFLQLDLASLKGTKEAAEEFLRRETRLDGLVANAGVMAVPYELTEVSWRLVRGGMELMSCLAQDGVETQFQVNHLAHWLLAVKLAPLMEKTGEVSIFLPYFQVVPGLLANEKRNDSSPATPRASSTFPPLPTTLCVLSPPSSLPR